jgi:hypothetical protein
MELERELASELEPPLGVVAMAELGDGGWTPASKRGASKRGEELMSSPPGDEPPSPAVRLRRFQVLERRHSSGDTTVIDKDRILVDGSYCVPVAATHRYYAVCTGTYE